MDIWTAPLLADYALNPNVRSNRPSPTSANVVQSYDPSAPFDVPIPIHQLNQRLQPHPQEQPHAHSQHGLQPYPPMHDLRISTSPGLPQHPYAPVRPPSASDAQFAFSFPPSGPFGHAQHGPYPHATHYALPPPTAQISQQLQQQHQNQYWVPGSSSSYSDTISLGPAPGRADLTVGSTSTTGVEADHDDSELDADAYDEVLVEGDFSRSPDHGSPGDASGSGLSPVKKPRITLPRGRACVACRTRKLKCSGIQPCPTCIKAGLECRFEEIRRKKPRNVLLEERVVELESILTSKGEALPPTRLRTTTASSSSTASSSKLVIPRLSPSKDASGAFAFPLPIIKTSRKGSTPSLSGTLQSGRPSSAASVLTSRSASLSQPYAEVHHRPPSRNEHQQQRGSATSSISQGPGHSVHSGMVENDIACQSVLEATLIRVALPYTPHLSIPVHPYRLLAILSLSPTDPDRPHPALLYILFAHAVHILETGMAAPPLPQIPPSFFGANTTAPLVMPAAPSEPEKAWALSQVRGNSEAYLQRARAELEIGIRQMDRPLDLVRAAVGIARYLTARDRENEAWSIPVARMAVACGLHRLTGVIVQPDTAPRPLTADPSTYDFAHSQYLPRPFATSNFYQQQRTFANPPPPIRVLRERSIAVPPPRDEIDLAERVMTFWAVKAHDYCTSLASGWSTALSDDDCTTEWPWGWGGLETRPPEPTYQPFGIRDLVDTTSAIHLHILPESTHVLSMKSLSLLNRANQLDNSPSTSIPSLQPDGRYLPNAFPSLNELQMVETALSLFRQRIPPDYAFPPPPKPALAQPPIHHAAQSPDMRGIPSASYDALADPWYICLHMNLLAAEMLTYRELANYDRAPYHQCIASARSIVGLVQSMQPEHWVHLDLSVVICISLAARLLFREAERLGVLGQLSPANMAAEEAEILRLALASEYAKWTPVASAHAQIIQRARDGLAGAEGECERV